MALDNIIKIDNTLKALKNKDLTKEQLLAVIDRSPLCIDLWNYKYECIFCNQYATTLFEFDTKEEYLKNHAYLAPKFQPTGKLSVDEAQVQLRKTVKEGSARFNWMHCKLDGTEIPAEVTLYKLDIVDENGNIFIAAFVRDLRSQLAGYENDDISNGYFFNSISDRVLFNTVAELSDEWFWSYNIRTSMIQFFGKGMSILNLSKEKQLFPQSIIEKGVVYQDDIAAFLEFSQDIKTGFTQPHDIRFILPDKSIKYFRLVFKTIYNNEGKPLFTIGKTYDIHNQKTLEVLSRTDLLTNCLNKVTTENTIKADIAKSNGNIHAFFIVDIDNFKAVNDNLGHHFWDQVLKEISDNLHSNFRSCDIIGRIGGDEFIVFIKNVVDLEILEKKAKTISNAFKNTYSGESGDYKISGSIGISLFPKDGATYEDLYKSADKALYHSKLQGKDCFTFYTDDLVDGTMKNLTIVDNANRIANSYFDADLVSTIFDLMYESKDVDVSLNTVLKLIGKRINSDRCYIFETFDEGKNYSVTYEWCNKNVSKEINNLQNISKEVLGDFFDVLDENGVLYSNDVKLIESEDAYELIRGQSIKSFLLVHTKGKEYTRLVLGLDDCKHSRVWSEKEINSVKYALKMISIFMASNDNRKKPNFDGMGLTDEEKMLIQKLENKGFTISK